MDRVREGKALWRKTWREKNGEEARKRARGVSAAYRGRNPLKEKARGAVRRALEKGTLVKGPCAVCGSAENVHAHHVDYAEPLNVQWLCACHHAELHGGSEKETPYFDGTPEDFYAENY